jgi:hypothetical protein
VGSVYRAATARGAVVLRRLTARRLLWVRLLILAGLCSITAGVAVLYGLGLALITGGGCAVLFGLTADIDGDGST